LNWRHTLEIGMARIGLVAHDDKKDELCAWADRHKRKLSEHRLWGTGTTGSRVIAATGMPVTLLKSGPLGGDQQLGAMIAEGRLDVLIFFIDPLSAQPHDVDVKALTRLATLYDVMFANNEATANAVLAYL
jgi:methylglyoxal synthase